jgi:hypothetical protein
VERQRKAETGRSDRKNFIRSIRPLLDPSAGDAGNGGELALGVMSGTALPKSCCLSLPFQNNLVALLYLQDFLTMTRSIIAALLALAALASGNKGDEKRRGEQ